MSAFTFPLPCEDAAFAYDTFPVWARLGSGCEPKSSSMSRSVFFDMAFFSGDTSMSLVDVGESLEAGGVLRKVSRY